MEHRFKLYDTVAIKARPGRTGKIVFIELHGTVNRYLLNCYPGALGHYDWCIYTDETGKERTEALNWFNEDELDESSV
jgi:hypothetical protein